MLHWFISTVNIQNNSSRLNPQLLKFFKGYVTRHLNTVFALPMGLIILECVHTLINLTLTYVHLALGYYQIKLIRKWSNDLSKNLEKENRMASDLVK